MTHQTQPHINWATGAILGWGLQRSATCLKSASVPTACVTNDNDYPCLENVPPEYYDLREVINKGKAMSLSPHRPSDCALDL